MRLQVPPAAIGARKLNNNTTNITPKTVSNADKGPRLTSYSPAAARTIVKSVVTTKKGIEGNKSKRKLEMFYVQERLDCFDRQKYLCECPERALGHLYPEDAYVILCTLPPQGKKPEKVRRSMGIECLKLHSKSKNILFGDRRHKTSVVNWSITS